MLETEEAKERMEVTIEVARGLRRRMTVAIPESDAEARIEQKLRAIAKTARIQGFRPGKVPFKMVTQRYRPQVEAEVVGDVVQSTCLDALSEQGLNLAGRPTLQSHALKDGNVFEYTVAFEVLPEFEVAGLDKIVVERPKVEVTEANIDRMIETLRRQRMTWEETTRPARKEDRLVISFQGSIDGNKFDGGSAEGMPLVLGSGAMLSAFEGHLIGMKGGEEKTFELTFPADYRGKAVAGKTARFTVTVASVSAPVLPPVDDAFIKSFGVDNGDVRQLREGVRENMRREMGQAVMAGVKSQIMEGLLRYNQIELPDSLVAAEIAQLREAAKEDIKRAGGRVKAELPAAAFEERARRRVALGLLLDALIKSHDIQLDEGKFDAEVKAIAATYEQPDMVERAYRQREDLRRGVRATVMENQLIDALLGVVNVAEVEKDFYEVAQNQA